MNSVLHRASTTTSFVRFTITFTCFGFGSLSVGSAVKTIRTTRSPGSCGSFSIHLHLQVFVAHLARLAILVESALRASDLSRASADRVGDFFSAIAVW